MRLKFIEQLVSYVLNHLKSSLDSDDKRIYHIFAIFNLARQSLYGPIIEIYILHKKYSL
jgi:hypothetical protein